MYYNSGSIQSPTPWNAEFKFATVSVWYKSTSVTTSRTPSVSSFWSCAQDRDSNHNNDMCMRSHTILVRVQNAKYYVLYSQASNYYFHHIKGIWHFHKGAPVNVLISMMNTHWHSDTYIQSCISIPCSICLNRAALRFKCGMSPITQGCSTVEGTLLLDVYEYVDSKDVEVCVVEELVELRFNDVTLSVSGCGWMSKQLVLCTEKHTPNWVCMYILRTCTDLHKNNRKI